MKRQFGVLVLTLSIALMASSSYAVLFTASLDSASENNPANTSPGTGFAMVEFDPIAHTLSISAVFSGLTAAVSDAHIHCCTLPPNNAGVAVPGAGALPGFPLGVTSGSYSNVFDTLLDSTYRPAFITTFGGGTASGAEAALFAGLLDGRAYFNIHTTNFPGGEIRGFLQAVPEPVPEPGTLGLCALGLTALVVAPRLRRRLTSAV